jgi:hypothetical protein
MFAEKSWCTNTEIATLSRALEATIGFTIDVWRPARTGGVASMRSIVSRAFTNSAGTQVSFRYGRLAGFRRCGRTSTTGFAGRSGAVDYGWSSDWSREIVSSIWRRSSCVFAWRR